MGTLVEIAEVILPLSQPSRTWTNPDEPAWYEWSLGARNQGPRMSVRLATPFIPRITKSQQGPFKLLAIRSPGTKKEMQIATLFRVNYRDGWQRKVVQRIEDAWDIMWRAPHCPACGAATFPEQVRATKRLFWCCCKFPLCRGSRRTQKMPNGQWPTTHNDLLLCLPPKKT